MTTVITTRDQAIAFLDSRIGSGVKPGLERISGLVELMGDPHRSSPTIHVAGTNGKTSTVRMIEQLVRTHGLRVGTFVSPHLDRIEERFAIDGETISEDDFVDAVSSTAAFIELYEQQHDTTITYFEATAALAFAVFELQAVDVAVVEVGLGGRLDATNVVEAEVSVITGIAMDHMSYLGTTLGEIAAEKVGILKQRGHLVTGPLPAAAEGAITAHVAATQSTWSVTDTDFSVGDAIKAVGGWQCVVEGIYATYDEIFLPLHGQHQVHHFATAIAALEALFGRALDVDSVRRAATKVTSPGRLEIIHRKPLIIADGAHNHEGLEGLAMTLFDEFPDTGRVLIIGFRGERDVASLVQPLADMFDRVIATSADDPDAIDADTVAAAVTATFGDDVAVDIIHPIHDAVVAALERTEPDEIIVVTGSLYVVGEARRTVEKLG